MLDDVKGRQLRHSSISIGRLLAGFCNILTKILTKNHRTRSTMNYTRLSIMKHKYTYRNYADMHNKILA